MERIQKNINKKVANFLIQFKNDIKEKIHSLNFEDQKAEQLLKFMYDYKRLSIEKDDLQKRKRVKNIVPTFERCRAKRANGEQCTRRKKTSHQLCGTHIKGTPHGMIQLSEKVDEMKKISIWAQDIKGIIYYIDENHHVYDTKDIYENKINPKIIARWEKNDDGDFILPQIS